jgi:hypothetical protein
VRIASGAREGEDSAEVFARIEDDLKELRRAVADEFGLARRRQAVRQRRMSRRIREVTRTVADLTTVVEQLARKDRPDVENIEAEKGKASLAPVSGATRVAGRRTGEVER